MEILASAELWIAVVSGGIGVKLLDSILNRRKNKNDVDADEKESLRKDIEYLREQIAELRTEIDTLRRELRKRDKDVSFWQKKYWDKKLELDRVITHVNHLGNDQLKESVKKTLDSSDDILDLTGEYE